MVFITSFGLLYHTKRYKGTTTGVPSSTTNYDYIIPKDIRELRLETDKGSLYANYIIPKDIRELRLETDKGSLYANYIIPKDIRELRHK